MKIEVVKTPFKNLLVPKTKKTSYTLYVVNPVFLIVFGILIFSTIAGFSSKPKPTLTPTPTSLVSPSPSAITFEPILELTPTTSLPSITPEVKGIQTQKVLVTRVIDGDTVEIEGGEKVRYIGIDTPETVDPRKPVQCYGKEASDKNKELVEGKEVKLEKDISETDKYGRLLRYVWLGDILVNEYLVKEGYAQVSTYPPDVKYQDRFLAAQREARENKRGLWEACSYFGQPEATPTPKPLPTSTPKPTPTPKPTTIPVSPSQSSVPKNQEGNYNCSTNTYNCSYFQYQEDAQYVFNYCGGLSNDIHYLDADKDGVACETLPRRTSTQQSSPQNTQPITPLASGGGGGGYTCNCSKTCSQMSSCEEAYFQLRNCGCLERDGDGDGVPCESLCR